MNELNWKMEYYRLYGELSGFLKVLTEFDIPLEMVDRIIAFAEEKEKHFNKLIELEEDN